MKLTAQVKLLPTQEQKELLFDTLKEANAACDFISERAWSEKCFSRFKLHKRVYYTTKESFNLSSQMIIHCISKVADAYKLDKKKQRYFRKYGSISYDYHLLSYKEDRVSIWTTGKRQKIPFVTGEHHAKLLKYRQGEANLAYINGKFYLFQACEIPEENEHEFENVLGVDLGITNIATDSTGEIHSGKSVNEYREKRRKATASLQSKGTKGAKKVLKKQSGKEKTTVKIINHTIAKHIVQKAKSEGMCISLENLKGIRERTNKRLRKSQRGLHNRWSFFQLKQFVLYKAKLAGVPVFEINPAYTSKTCNKCKHIGKRSGEKFRCTACGYSGHADVNAASVIAQVGASVNRPEEPIMYCSVALHGQV